MSTKKRSMMAEYYVCDFCGKSMHLVNETRSYAQCRDECVHTKKIDAHIKCVESATKGDKDG